MDDNIFLYERFISAVHNNIFFQETIAILVYQDGRTEIQVRNPRKQWCADYQICEKKKKKLSTVHREFVQSHVSVSQLRTMSLVSLCSVERTQYR